MHPAPSVIFFSVLSGAGFGLLTLLGFGARATSQGWPAFVFFAVGFVLAVGGLLSATLHLANPKNAIYSFSQWRTSWLSREGISAVAALSLMGLYAALIIFFDIRVAPLGYVAGALCLFTVFTTAMIYTQIKAVPRWHQPLATPALFLSFALTGGALLAGAVAHAGFLFLLTALIQLWHWNGGDKAFRNAGTNMNTATGLKGAVRQYEAPHTGDNYLLKEMVYVVGRKHAFKLRIIALLFAALIPSFMMLGEVKHLGALIAVALYFTGTFASRWLFFAEAEHVVGLYYGKR